MAMRRITKLVRQGGHIHMPGGFCIKIRVLDKWEADEEIGTENLAEFVHANQIINLRESRPVKQRRTDLEHELQHACVDWIDHFMRRAK